MNRGINLSTMNPQDVTVDQVKELQAICEAAINVRRNQKEYFRTRSQYALLTSKDSEKLLDDLLAGPKVDPGQKELL